MVSDKSIKIKNKKMKKTILAIALIISSIAFSQSIKSTKKLLFSSEDGMEGYIKREMGWKQLDKENKGWTVQITDYCLNENDSIIAKKEIKPSFYSMAEVKGLLQLISPIIDKVDGDLMDKLFEAFYQALLLETKTPIKDAEGNYTNRYRYTSDTSVWVRYTN